MVTHAYLTTLTVSEKREIVRALLGSTLAAPRSFPLSFAQEQLWFMDKLEPGSPVYNIPLYVPFPGRCDVPRLNNALYALARRHDMLRAHFDAVDGEPRQVIEPSVRLDLAVEDLTPLAPERRRDALGRLLNEEVQRPFDLTAGVCARYKLFRVDAEEYLLSVTMHHIITDAWSLGIYVSELRAIYDGPSRGATQVTLPPLPLEYSDYAKWQRRALHGLRLSKLLDYWTKQLAAVPQVLHIPTDRPRPKDQTFNGAVVGFVLPDELSDSLVALSRDSRVTLFTVLLACYYVLLYRYTGQEDIVVGAPVANRGHPELEPIIGLFVNTLILRVRLHESDTFSEVLREVSTTALDAFDHQALPFHKLVEELHVQRVPGYPPLYQIVFNFQNASLIESGRPMGEGEAMLSAGFPSVHSNTSKVDLNLTITQSESSVSGGIEYNTDLFDSETVDEMISHFLSIAEAVAVDQSVPILDIRLHTDTDRPPPRAIDDAQAGAQNQEEFIHGGQFNFELND